MNLESTAEKLQVKLSVREFTEAEIALHVLEWDETQHFPIELIPKLPIGEGTLENSTHRDRQGTASSVTNGTSASGIQKGV